MTIGNKIKILREEQGLSQEELAQKIGYKSKTSIHKIEQNITDLPLSKVNEFAQILNTTPSYLMGWEEESKETINNLIEKQDNIWKIKPTRKIPIISEIACGSPIIYDDGEQDIIEVEDYVKGDFAFKARGDSMINAGIESGDIVFISKDRYINNGDIVAVSIEDEITLKTYRKKDNKLYFLPENSDYDPIIFDAGELEYTNINIIGLATHILKSIK